MSAIRLLALILLCTILLGACGRSDLIRVRLLSPISETKKDHSIFSNLTSVSTSKTTSADPKTSGGSLYFLFKSIGLGLTTLTTQIEKEARTTAGDVLILKEKTTLVTNFTDLAFGIGENYSFMWGAGVLAGGSRLDTSLSYGNVYSGATDETIKHKYLSGHSIFLVVGHHGYGFETLLGFRINYIKAEIEDSGSSAKIQKTKTAASLNYESTGIRITTNQLQLGIGFTF